MLNNIKLFLIGIAIGVIMFLIAACASAPICPEITFKFCAVTDK